MSPILREIQATDELKRRISVNNGTVTMTSSWNENLASMENENESLHEAEE